MKLTRRFAIYLRPEQRRDGSYFLSEAVALTSDFIPDQGYLSTRLTATDIRRFPPQRTKNGEHGWAVFTLPYIEQTALKEKYNMTYRWDHINNAEAIRTIVPLFQCPSSRPSSLVWAPVIGNRFAATNDYAPPGSVSRRLATAGYIRERPSYEGLFVGSKATKFRDALDGVSNTLLFAEDTTRPEFWAGGKLGPNNTPSGGGNFGVTGGVVKGAAWADSRSGIPMHGFMPDGLTSPGPCPINCTNNNEMFSLHAASGIQILIADGAVRFVTESVDIDVMASWITARGHELEPFDEYAL